MNSTHTTKHKKGLVPSSKRGTEPTHPSGPRTKHTVDFYPLPQLSLHSLASSATTHRSVLETFQLPQLFLLDSPEPKASSSTTKLGAPKFMRAKRSVDFRMAPKKSTGRGRRRVQRVAVRRWMMGGWRVSSLNLIFSLLLMNVFCNRERPSSGALC